MDILGQPLAKGRKYASESVLEQQAPLALPVQEVWVPMLSVE